MFYRIRLTNFLFSVALSAVAPAIVVAEGEENPFFDQQHYEFLYDWTYQRNLVESLIFECTGERGISFHYAMAQAGLSNSYKRYIMGDPDGPLFSKDRLITRVWREVALAVSRDLRKHGGEEPTLAAQKDVLAMVQSHADEQEFLCDFLFWDEVSRLAQMHRALLNDLGRFDLSEQNIQHFYDDTKEERATLNKLFGVIGEEIPEPKFNGYQ